MLVVKPILTEVTLHHEIASSLPVPLFAMTIKIEKSITIFVIWILILFNTLFFPLTSSLWPLNLFNLARNRQFDVATIAPEINLVVKFIDFVPFMAMDWTSKTDTMGLNNLANSYCEGCGLSVHWSNQIPCFGIAELCLVFVTRLARENWLINITIVISAMFLNELVLKKLRLDGLFFNLCKDHLT